MLKGLLDHSKQIAQLEKEKEEMAAEMRNTRAAIYLKNKLIKEQQSVIDNLKRDCKHIESAFETYVNDTEEERAEMELRVKLMRGNIRERMAS